MLFWLTASVLVSSLLLGGGTRNGFLSDAVLQLISIPLLLLGSWRILDGVASRPARLPLALCLATVLVPLVQLIPLPPTVWTALPSRAVSASAFELLERDVAWMPISVSPQATWLSALSLLPAVAIFLGTLLSSSHARRKLSLVMLAVGGCTLFVGLLQMAQGASSPLRFFEHTNPTEPVGFFANRNHFAALLCALILFAAAWTVDATLAARRARSGGRETHATVAMVAGFTILVALVAAQAMARSRAGLSLTIVALFGAVALAYSDGRRMSGFTPTKLLLGAAGLAVVFAVQFALYRILERFVAIDPIADSRIQFAVSTIEAAKAHMPLGSGTGTFEHVYGLFERPQDAMANTFVNRAHNDVLEVWLETGALGPILMAFFLYWLVTRSIAVWRPVQNGMWGIDAYLTRAATIVIALLIAHSFADYPLRTAAIMAVMAFSCALLIESPVAVVSDAVKRADPAITTSREMPTRSAGPPAHAGERWGEDLEWPREWRKPPPN